MEATTITPARAKKEAVRISKLSSSEEGTCGSGTQILRRGGQLAGAGVSKETGSASLGKATDWMMRALSLSHV